MSSALDYECWVCGAAPGEPCREPAAPEPGTGLHSERGPRSTCECGGPLPAGHDTCLFCQDLERLDGRR